MKYYCVKSIDDKIKIEQINFPVLDTDRYKFLIVADYPYFDVIPTTLAIKTLNDQLIIDFIRYIRTKVFN